MKIKSDSKIEIWIKSAVVLVVIYIIFRIIIGINNKSVLNDELNKTGVITTGKIYKIDEGMRALTEIYWSYEVSGVKYYNFVISRGLAHFERYKEKYLNTSIEVEYARDNPSNSRIIVKNKKYLGTHGSTNKQ